MSIPIDLVGLLRDDLLKDKRKPDGLLHASSDLKGSLRHTQLRSVGAPTKPEDIVSMIRTRTGWFWHNHLGELLVNAGVPVIREVDLTPWMPEGWSGTADWLFWHPRYEAYVLGDLKTTKGEAIKWKESEGMSEDHWWQLSAYWYACVEAGFPMLDRFGVLYLPMNTSLKDPGIAPTVLEARPVPEDTIRARMDEVKKAVDYYVEGVEAYRWQLTNEDGSVQPGLFLADGLAPPLERVQKLVWDGKKGHWNVVLVPHWLTDFCPYENELCDCSEQGTTKIGEWRWYEGDGLEDNPDHLYYESRKGYEDAVHEELLIMPSEREIKRRIK